MTPELPEIVNSPDSRNVVELAEFRMHTGAIRAAGCDKALREKAGWGTCGANGLTMTLPVRNYASVTTIVEIVRTVS
jgi:hypothetical protein